MSMQRRLLITLVAPVLLLGGVLSQPLSHRTNDYVEYFVRQTRERAPADFNTASVNLQAYVKNGMTIPWSTACSGVDALSQWVPELVGAVGRHCNKFGDCLKVHKISAAKVLTQSFLCENNKQKTKFIADHGLLPRTMTLFEDIAVLGEARAKNSLTNKPVDIPWSAIFFAGFSCTSVSRCNVHSHTYRGAIRAGIGQSAITFMGCLAYIESHKPVFFALENVPSVDDHSDDAENNAAAITTMLIALGYWVVKLVLRAEEYGLPQRRERYWFIGERQNNRGSRLHIVVRIVLLCRSPTVFSLRGLIDYPRDNSDNANIAKRRKYTIVDNDDNEPVWQTQCKAYYKLHKVRPSK